MGRTKVELLEVETGDRGSDCVPSTKATSCESCSTSSVEEPVRVVKVASARVRARYCGVWVNDRSSSKVWAIVRSCFKADFCGRERGEDKVGDAASTSWTAAVTAREVLMLRGAVSVEEAPAPKEGKYAGIEASEVVVAVVVVVVFVAVDGDTAVAASTVIAASGDTESDEDVGDASNGEGSVSIVVVSGSTGSTTSGGCGAASLVSPSKCEMEASGAMARDSTSLVSLPSTERGEETHRCCC